MAFLEFRVIRWGLRFWKFGAFGLGALGVQGLGAYCRFIRYSGDVRVAFFSRLGTQAFSCNAVDFRGFPRHKGGVASLGWSQTLECSQKLLASVSEQSR